MTREERKTEIRIIKSHLITVMDDTAAYRNRLEEIGCKREAERLDTITGKLYDLVCKLDTKS